MTPSPGDAMIPLALGGAAVGWCAFVTALFAGSLVAPGARREGRPGPDGRRAYRLNGLALFALTALAVAAAMAMGLWSPAVVVRHVAALFVVANVFALVASAALYAAAPGPTPRGARAALRAFVLGRAHDPVWAGVSLKLFSYRPSLIGLGLVNVGFAAAQYERHGVVAVPMVLYVGLSLAYVANYFAFEHGMLYTWDLLEERFGLALVWGDYVFVPFFYSLPGWYLLDRTAPPAPAAIAGVLVLWGLGFWLFRGANGQKHRFKIDPHTSIWGRPAEALDGRLLVSGFWGIGRKLNYTGELLVYLAWTLPCGGGSLVPYLPVLWLAVFFPHRARRDERRCRAKYGALWDAYCARVPFRMIPFIY